MLGIDIGNYSVKAAVGKSSGKRAVIDAIAVEVLPEEMRGGRADPMYLQQVVSRLVKRVGRGQAKVALSVPTSSVIMKTISVDAGISPALLEPEVQLALVDFVPFPLDQVYSDFVSLGKSGQGSDFQDVFVIASRREVVDRISNSVSVRTIKEKEIDVEVFSYGQILEKIKGKNYHYSYAIIDIGYKSTNIYIFANGEMLFSREQQIGGAHLTEAISEMHGVNLSEAETKKIEGQYSKTDTAVSTYFDSLSEQISLAFEFYQSTAGGGDVESVYLSGGGSLSDGLVAALSENIPHLKFEKLSMNNEIRFGKKVMGVNGADIGSSAAVAIGLSMRK